jgi:hypothetical protein
VHTGTAGTVCVSSDMAVVPSEALRSALQQALSDLLASVAADAEVGSTAADGRVCMDITGPGSECRQPAHARLVRLRLWLWRAGAAAAVGAGLPGARAAGSDHPGGCQRWRQPPARAVAGAADPRPGRGLRCGLPGPWTCVASSEPPRPALASCMHHQSPPPRLMSRHFAFPPLPHPWPHPRHRPHPQVPRRGERPPWCLPTLPG